MRRDLSWKELVQASWGKEYTAPEHVYEFSGGRKFYNETQGGAQPVASPDGGSLYADNWADNYA